MSKARKSKQSRGKSKLSSRKRKGGSGGGEQEGFFFDMSQYSYNLTSGSFVTMLLCFLMFGMVLLTFMLSTFDAMKIAPGDSKAATFASSFSSLLFKKKDA